MDKMRVNPRAQRDFREPWALKLYSEFNPDAMGLPAVSLRDGYYWVCDGVHRIDACRRWLGDWHGQCITCSVYKGLNEIQEAELFLRLNYTRPISAYALFNAGLTAKRETPTAVHNACEKRGIAIMNQLPSGGSEGAEIATSAVRALMNAHEKYGIESLGRSLTILRDALGTQGLKGPYLTAMSKICARYLALNDKHMIDRLSTIRGGLGSINNRATLLTRQLGQPKTECIAGAIVETYNGSLPKGKRLPDWWKVEKEA